MLANIYWPKQLPGVFMKQNRGKSDGYVRYLILGTA